MTIPDSPTLQFRTWNVVDQAIPVPYNTSSADLGRPTGSPRSTPSAGRSEPSADSPASAPASPRRIPPSTSPGSSDARSGTRIGSWMDPGQSLLADPTQGLDALLADLSDIRLTFETYGYSGN